MNKYYRLRGSSKNNMMEIKRNNISVRYYINILLVVWIVIWAYFAVFNWNVFNVKINMSLGFTVINSYPFIWFFVLGVLILLGIRYLVQYSRMLRQLEMKEKNNKIAMQEKDIEILKLKEVLFEMQSKEFNKSTANINALNEKLDRIIAERKEENLSMEKESETKKPEDKEK